MTELTLRGTSEDGTHLVLVDGAGVEYSLPVDDKLYAAVRKDKVKLDNLNATRSDLRPRDIQAMVRSGMTAQEVVESTGASLEHVRSYEHPVLAERSHIATLAGRCLVYPSEGSREDPRTLVSLVTERLAAGGVDTESMSWDAWKKTTGSWYVQLEYVHETRDRRAGWEYSNGSIRPLDAEAKALVAPKPAESGPLPGQTLRAEARPADEPRKTSGGSTPERTAPRSAHARDPHTETGRILETLRRKRGKQPSFTEDGLTSVTEVPPLKRISRHGVLHSVAEDAGGGPDGAHTALGAPGDAHDTGIFAFPAEDSSAVGHAPVGAPEEPTSEVPAPARPGAHVAETAPTEPILRRGTDQVTAPAVPASAPEGTATPEVSEPVEETGTDSAAQDSEDTTTAPPKTAPKAPRQSSAKKSGRSSIPSWDEIMFGSKKD